MTAKVLLLVLGVLLGAAGGGYFGVRSGHAVILNQCLDKDARDVQSSVVTLRHLRAGERERAVEALEARMDDALIPFDPESPYDGLTDTTTGQIDKALREVKDYRGAHPRKSSRPHVDAMVGNLLSRVK
jgi:hypothetical protein